MFSSEITTSFLTLLSSFYTQNAPSPANKKQSRVSVIMPCIINMDKLSRQIMGVFTGQKPMAIVR